MTHSGQQHFTRAQLVQQLREAGVRQSDLLVVHSALSKVGWIAKGPREMISALREAVGPSGTIVMPTFTFNLDGWNLPPFDPWRTPSRVGLLTEHFRRLPDVIRSLHPTHSVAAVGPLATRIVAGPIDYEPLGKRSPLDRASELGARILLIGVGNNRNSTVHVAESRAAMPYLHVPFTEGADHDTAQYFRDRKGTLETITIHETPGSSEGFDILDSLLVELGVARSVLIGAARSQIMPAADLCTAVEGLLRTNPLLFLQNPLASEISIKRRSYIQSLASRGVVRT